ncbi:MAG: hypothetical protein R2822_14010 [Spirosomataceae bacterium]
MHRPFLPIAIRTFEGLIEEKHHKNDHEAEKVYLSVLRLPADDEYTKEYRAFAMQGWGVLPPVQTIEKGIYLLQKKYKK